MTRNNEDNEMDVRKLNIPAFMIFGIVGFFIWVTWIANDERNNLSNRLTTIENRLAAIDERIRELHSKGPDYSNMVSRYDFRIWCLEAQLTNPNWKCPTVQNNGTHIINKMNDADIIRELEIQKLKEKLEKSTIVDTPAQ